MEIIQLETFRSFLCVADKERAKQFRRMRKDNMKARKKAARVSARSAKYEKKHYHYIARKGICQ